MLTLVFAIVACRTQLADDICVRRSESSRPDAGFALSRKLLDVMRRNALSNHAIKWQYVGTEFGTFSNYPADKVDSCVDFDPRVRY